MELDKTCGCETNKAKEIEKEGNEEPKGTGVDKESEKDTPFSLATGKNFVSQRVCFR